MQMFEFSVDLVTVSCASGVTNITPFREVRLFLLLDKKHSVSAIE